VAVMRHCGSHGATTGSDLNGGSGKSSAESLNSMAPGKIRDVHSGAQVALVLPGGTKGYTIYVWASKPYKSKSNNKPRFSRHKLTPFQEQFICHGIS
jgi:hypothetical protein